MSETKLDAKQWGHSEKFSYHRENFRYHSEKRKFSIIAKNRYDSENLALRKFRDVCEIFAMSNSEIF